MNSAGRILLIVIVGLGTWPSVPRDPTAPVRIVRTAKYTDGGSVCFEAVGFLGRRIVGGFDLSNWELPSRCFLGALHASHPRARLLPLYGREERAVVRLLGEALKHQLPFGTWRRARDAETHGEVPQGFDAELLQLSRYVDFRRRQLESVDRGDWFGREALRAELGKVELVALERSSPGDEGESIRVGVRLNGKNTSVYSFPSAPAGWTGPSRRLRARGESEAVFGSLLDRHQTLWAHFSLESPSTPPSPLASELRELLERRLRRIREDDEKR